MASPPCEVYSKANTTGKVDEESLKSADELVEYVFHFQEHLKALATVVENPATGRLVTRKVCKHSSELHCRKVPNKFYSK